MQRCQAFLKMSEKSLNISTSSSGAFDVLKCCFRVSKKEMAVKDAAHHCMACP